jgi:hypothetical protein
MLHAQVKRIVAFVLAVLMVVSLLPQTLYASTVTDPQGTGITQNVDDGNTVDDDDTVDDGDTVDDDTTVIDGDTVIDDAAVDDDGTVDGDAYVSENDDESLLSAASQTSYSIYFKYMSKNCNLDIKVYTVDESGNRTYLSNPNPASDGIVTMTSRYPYYSTMMLFPSAGSTVYVAVKMQEEDKDCIVEARNDDLTNSSFETMTGEAKGETKYDDDATEIFTTYVIDNISNDVLLRMTDSETAKDNVELTLDVGNTSLGTLDIYADGGSHAQMSRYTNSCYVPKNANITASYSMYSADDVYNYVITKSDSSEREALERTTEYAESEESSFYEKYNPVFDSFMKRKSL